MIENIYKEIKNYIEQGNKVTIVPKFHKKTRNPFNNREVFEYFVCFDLVYDDVCIDLPNIPGTSQGIEIKDSGLDQYINQYVLSGTNLTNLKKEIRRNWDKKYWKLDSDAMATPAWLI